MGHHDHGHEEHNHAHHHGLTHSHGEHMHVHGVSNNLWIAFGLNFVFTIIEIIGGLLTNSVAVLSDALHDAGDTIAIGSALFFEKFSQRKRDRTFTYGYRRFTVLSAFITALILAIGSGFIIYSAIERIMHPEDVKADGMIIMAILGVVFNGLAVIKLMASKSQSMNQQAVYLHLLEDALGWVAVLIGAIVMYFFDLPIIDPLLSLGIAAYILVNAVKMIFSAMRVFLQAVPKNLDVNKVKETILSQPHVKDLHDLHIWTIEGQDVVLTAHVVVEETCSPGDYIGIKREVKVALSDIGIYHATLELEEATESCMFIGTGTCEPAL